MNRTPRHGDVYRDADGDLLVFVGTVRRPGRSVWTGAGPDDFEHLFVGVDADKGVSFKKWYLAGGRSDARPLPRALQLVVNAGAEDRIAELEGQVSHLEVESAAFVAAMKAAVTALPEPVARHVRGVYRETRGRLLTKGEA